MLPNVHNIVRNMSQKTKQTIFLLLEYSLRCFKRYKSVQNYEQKKPARNLYEKSLWHIKCDRVVKIQNI